MKKLLLIILLSFIITGSFGFGQSYVCGNRPLIRFQITTIADTTSSFILRASSGKTVTINWGDGNDTTINFISTSNHTATHTYIGIGVWNGDIIGDIVDITYIKCIDDKLTNLSIWNLNKLTNLEAYRNRQMGIFDLHNLQNLKYLYIAVCGLTELDLTGFPELIDIDCSQNSLTSLDITKNTKLRKFNAWENNFSSSGIDFTNNNSVYHIELDLCGLSSLGISNLILTNLTLYHNSFSVTDVSNFLIYLDGLNNNGGKVDFCQTPAAIPNAAGQTAKTNLINKGWTVITD
jgi:hypothetical protein